MVHIRGSLCLVICCFVIQSSVVSGAYRTAYQHNVDAEAEYNAVVKEIEEFAESQGRRPRILVAKMGQDGHDRGAKVIASGYSDMGFDVDVGPLFSVREDVCKRTFESITHRRTHVYCSHRLQKKLPVRQLMQMFTALV